MKRHFVPFLICAALFLATPVTLCAAADGIVLTEDVQLKMADAFLAQGEYYLAVTEYKKFLILFRWSQNVDYALFSMGMAYFRGEEYKQAVDAFASVRQKYINSGPAPAADFYEGLSYDRMNMPYMAGKAFDRVTGLYPSGVRPHGDHRESTAPVRREGHLRQQKRTGTVSRELSRRCAGGECPGSDKYSQSEE